MGRAHAAVREEFPVARVGENGVCRDGAGSDQSEAVEPCDRALTADVDGTRLGCAHVRGESDGARACHVTEAGEKRVARHLGQFHAGPHLDTTGREVARGIREPPRDVGRRDEVGRFDRVMVEERIPPRREPVRDHGSDDPPQTRANGRRHGGDETGVRAAAAHAPDTPAVDHGGDPGPRQVGAGERNGPAGVRAAVAEHGAVVGAEQPVEEVRRLIARAPTERVHRVLMRAEESRMNDAAARIHPLPRRRRPPGTDSGDGTVVDGDPAMHDIASRIHRHDDGVVDDELVHGDHRGKSGMRPSANSRSA